MHDAPYFDRVAPVYGLVMPPVERATLDRGLRRAERPVERILDVGGGTGRAARALEDAVVVDAAHGMLRRARDAGLECVLSDVGHLAVADASVDAVVVVDALHHFPDAERAVREAARALRPGGILVVREFDPTTVRGRLLVFGERLVGFDSTFYDPPALERRMRDAGLSTAVPERGFGYTVTGVKGDEPADP